MLTWWFGWVLISGLLCGDGFGWVLVICDFGCFSGVWLGALRLFGVRLLVASLFVLRGFVFVCGLGGIMVLVLVWVRCWFWFDFWGGVFVGCGGILLVRVGLRCRVYD